MSRSAKHPYEQVAHPLGEPEAEITITARVRVQPEASGTRLKAELDAILEAQASSAVASIGPTPPLVPPPDATPHDDLLRELAARGARTSWLPLRPSRSDATLGIASLAPSLTVAPPARPSPLSRALATRRFAIVALGIVTLIAMQAWLLLRG